MKKEKNNIERQIPNARYDAEMNKYSNTILFPEKLARAEEKFKNVNFKKFVNELEAAKVKEEQ